ncbi:DUF3320 domain-containing protein [Modestobacter italicus]|uniref:DUF3320 domain-containing protein n=1 Tax=Modestobacter italicus (strain DSM 44449 / CECT 9708 / BC 501) TaxID=2732864 RepID=UPI0024848DED|nr:DUF4011 domain-containing protein [Modestobacter italicus]
MGNAADLQWSSEGPAQPSPSPVTVDLTVVPVLSEALAHSAVPVVSRLTLTSTDSSLQGATLRVSLHDAQGPIGAAVERLVDLDAARPTVLGDVGLTLDPATVPQGPDERPGWVHVGLESSGQVLLEQRVPVRLLPAAQWLAAPLPLALEVLAAHVQPHHPAVTALVAEAAALLQEGTESSSMAGYTDGAERVDEIVEALTWAVRRREIRHSEPPAGWAETGQRVRTPGEVLDGRAGTALDTVLTLAAACEHVGIRPLVWVVEGHAFLGYWRAERSAGAAATTDVAALVDLVDRGELRLVETTLLTDRGDTSADLHGPAHSRWLSGDLDQVVGVTDVHRARQHGVLPLPAPGQDGDAPVTGQHPGAPGSPAPVPAAADDTAAGVPARVREWGDALLGPGLRDRLLDHPEHAGIPLAVPHDALPLLEDLLSSGKTLTLLPGDPAAGEQRERGRTAARELPAAELTELLTGQRSVRLDLPPSDHLPRLRALAHRARSVVEQTSANDLHLALGSLVWELDGRTVRSPLVLVPVVLVPDTRDGSYRLVLDESGSSTVNGCLLAELRRHDLTVPGLTTSPDGAGMDLPAVLRTVRDALAGAELPHRVEATADLAVLPVAGYRLRADLDEHWSDFAANPLVAHLVDGPDEPFTDPVEDIAGPVDLDALAAQCPVPADAHQLRAVADALAGRTFVLQGPPGTGKSQTITNLLARAVAEGKRVLFVAGKRTALDVVARRLDAVGLGPFVLDLHDKGSRPAVVRAQVRAALEHAVEVDATGMTADAERLHSATRDLEQYAERLHAPNAAGLSSYSARNAVLATDGEVPALPVTTTFAARATPGTVLEVHRALALLPEIAGLARPSAGHAWAFLDTIDIDITAVQQAAVAVDAAIRDLPGEGGLASVVRAARTAEDLDAIVHLLTGPAVGLDVLDEVRRPRWTAATDDLTAAVAELVATEQPGLDVATPAVLALPLGDLFVQAQEAAAAGWMGRRGKLAAVRDQLAPALQPGASVRTSDVPELTADLYRLQTAVQTLAGRAAAVPGLLVPAGWNPFTDAGRTVLDAEVRWLRRAAASVDGSSGFTGAVRRFLAGGPVSDPSSARTVARLRDALNVLLAACSSDTALLAAWSGDDGLVLRWTMTRPERGVEYVHPMSLRRWVSLLDTLEPLRLAGLTEARAALRDGLLPADDAVRAFDRGLAEASLEERRTATGLDAFDAGQHERTVARFGAASRAVRSHLVDALPAGALAGRRLDADQVSTLREELAEQRHGLGVRGLLSTHGELITAVMPCVLAGPDAVARLLPAAPGLFDLVVFDEASQLRVADAVGAIGRAWSAVVVGDSQQLPPSTSGTPYADDEADPGTVADGESVLAACVRARVPQQRLSWHYRSQDESLIAFSNSRYYDGRLSSFPAPGPAAPGGRGVSLVRVEGTLVGSGPGRHTNPAEARAVVAEVLRRFTAAAPAAPSLGVVTVTAAQRTLIEELLRDSGNERVAAALDRTDGEGLLVKDVDAAQGDERDTVLLSLGAGPDAAGRLPLGLDPLSRAGGERRLNVAITRARRQVVVFCSFDPAQLRAEDTTSTGVAHLRAYLDLAALGTDALPRPARPAATTLDRHRDEVAAELAARGLVVRTDVGLSEFRIDLTVAHPEAPDSPVLAVLLDGPAWARRTTVGDRDGLPVEVLGELLHWPAVERVWLPTWLADREAVLSTLVAAVEAAAPPVVEPEPEPDPEPEYDGPLAEVIPLRPTVVLPPAPTPEPTDPVEPPAAEAEPSEVVESPVVESPVAEVEPEATDPVETPAAEAPATEAPATDVPATGAELAEDGPAGPSPADLHPARPEATDAGIEPPAAAGGPTEPSPAETTVADVPTAEPAPVAAPAATAARRTTADTDGTTTPTKTPTRTPSKTPTRSATKAPTRAAAKPAVASRSAEPLDEEQPFIAWSPRAAGDRKQLDQLADPAVAKVVRRVLTAGLKAEGPVHRDRLARLTAAAFGLSRVTGARRDALLALLPATATVDGEFVWPATVDPASWTWFRRQASSAERPLDQVPPAEVGNAMVALSRASAGLARDELFLRTLEVFGHRRRTPALLPLLESALDRVVAAGRLTEQPDGRFTA